MARSNLQIKVGSYIGTGTAQAITDVGFEPTLLLVKGGNNHSVFRTRHMRGDSTSYSAAALANIADSITALTSNGFTVGTDATANAAATTYYYLAFRGAAAQNYFRTFRYYGNGVDNRDITTAGLYFQPDFLTLKHDGLFRSSSRISAQSGDDAFHLLGNANAANEIQNFQANGFQVGSGSITNLANAEIHGFALRKLPGIIDTGTFTGNGTGQTVNVGFQPDWVIIKNSGTVNVALMKTSSVAGVSCLTFDNFGPPASALTALTATGFTVGSHVAANGNGNTVYYIAGKSGSFNTPLVRAVA